MPSREGEVVGFPPELFHKATSLFFWGEPRTLLNQVAFHAARLADPEFLWIEIRSASEARPVGEPAESNLLPRDRLVELRPEQLKPRLGRGTGLLSKFLALDAGGRLLNELVPFLQLPRVVASLIGRMVPAARPRVLAVANGDRIAQLYPPRRGLVRKFVGAIERLDIGLIVTYCGPERSDMSAWDHRFRLESLSTPEGPRFMIRCEKGPPSPQWKVDVPYALAEISGLLKTIQELENASAQTPPLAFIPALGTGKLASPPRSA